jgi:spore germination cell wall hydrolase CwlJ-like protein
MSDRSRWDEVVLFAATILMVAVATLVLFIVIVAVAGKLQAAPLCPPPDPGARPVVRLAAGEISQLARLAWAENRSSGYCGMLSVASVVINRIQEDPKTFGATITQVINKPYQFSVFGKADPNRRKMAKVSDDDDLFITAMLAAIAAVSGVENVGGALYFYSGKAPYWATDMVVTRHNAWGHTFLRPKP